MSLEASVTLPLARWRSATFAAPGSLALLVKVLFPVLSIFAVLTHSDLLDFDMVRRLLLGAIGTGEKMKYEGDNRRGLFGVREFF